MRTIVTALMLTLSMLLSAWSVSAQDDLVSPDQMRKPITKITEEQKHMYKITPLWENRFKTHFESDANENVHNMFIIGDIIYIYVDYYGGENAQKTILKRYNLSTGKQLESLTKDNSEMKTYIEEWKSRSTFKSYTVTHDDKNHIVAIYIRTASPDARNSTDGVLCIAVFDSNFKYITSYKCKDIFGTNLRFFSHLKAPSIEGDATSGNFNISYSGWFANVLGEPANQAVGNLKAKTYYPAIVTFPFRNSSCASYEPIYFETAGANNKQPVPNKMVHFYFPAGDAPSNDDLTNDQIAACKLSEKKWLVQRRREPIMMFEDKGKKLTVNGKEYPLLNQVEGVTNPFTSSDATYNFNPAVVKLTDRYSVYTISSFGNNISFSAYDLPNENDLSTLTSLGEISGESSFSVPSTLYYYDLYPFVTVVPMSDTQTITQTTQDQPATIIDQQKAKVITYFPGSGLGSYAVEVSQSDKPTGLVSVAENDTINFTIIGRNLTIEPTTDMATVDVTVTSTTGIQLLNRKAAPGTVLSLADFQPGVYCITVNSSARMVCLR